jgi:hypothetical protein
MQVKLSTKKSFNNWVKVGESENGDVKFLVDYPTREQQQKLDHILFTDATNNAQQLEYYRHYLKCVIKDWEGLDRECKLIGNELESDCWWALVSDVTQCVELYGAIFTELEFGEVDKKKSN